jgi:endo-1,4-beta-xylanase
LPSKSLVDFKVSDLKASREHRAFGGFSMGSVCTWYTFINCLDYIKYFMPISGDCWALGQDAGDSDPQETAEYLASIPKKAGYKSPDDYKVFCATGKLDIAYPNLKPQVDALKQLTDSFIYSSDTTKGNLYFIVSENGTHNWSFVNQYIYDILPDLFKAENAPVPTGTSVPTSTPTTRVSSGGSSSSGGSQTSYQTPTATATATPSPSATAKPTPVTKEDPKEIVPAVGFTDILDHWAKDFINDLLSKKILSGYEDGTIKPDKNISRAELTTIVVKAMGLEPSEKPVLDLPTRIRSRHGLQAT